MCQLDSFEKSVFGEGTFPANPHNYELLSSTEYKLFLLFTTQKMIKTFFSDKKCLFLLFSTSNLSIQVNI